MKHEVFVYKATPFDRWVQEAPFRHLGVFALMIIAVFAIVEGLFS